MLVEGMKYQEFGEELELDWNMDGWLDIKSVLLNFTPLLDSQTCPVFNLHTAGQKFFW